MTWVNDALGNLGTFFSGETNLTFVLLFFTAVIILYSVFVYYFYNFLARKNIISLNLNQYNNYENPSVIKFFAIVFYILEYIIFLPIITFFWFAVLSILILVMSSEMKIASVLLISSALVASVRVTSYISQDISKDLAKLLPFTLMAIAVTNPGFFNVASLLSRVIEIPSLFTNIPFYLLFIVAIELVMRVGEFLVNGFSSKEDEEAV